MYHCKVNTEVYITSKDHLNIMKIKLNMKIALKPRA